MPGIIRAGDVEELGLVAGDGLLPGRAAVMR